MTTPNAESADDHIVPDADSTGDYIPPDGDPSRPEGIDPVGVPTERSEREAFVMTLAAVIALLGLCFTLGWIVFNQLQTGG